MHEIQIDVYSDTVCPWCYVGKRQLERALAALPSISAKVRFRPFFLDPSVPPGGVDAEAYLLQKFGSARALDLMQTRIGGFAEQLGIVFDMRAQKKRPNTLDSHRLIHWAGASGVEDAVVEALFRAYFEQGRDIGDRDVLAAIADAAGLDADQTRARLELDDDVALIQSEVRAAFESGVTGVPTFSFEGLRIPGAQEPAVYESVIRRVIARRG